MRITAIIPKVLALTVLLIASGCGLQQPAASISDEKVVGAPAAEPELFPEFRYKNLSGAYVSSQNFRGKVLLVDVWATWCQPCKQEMPWFQELYDQYRDRGLEVIGISVDFGASDAAAYAKELGINYTLVHHPEVMAEWKLLGLPTTFIIDRSGHVRRKIIGFEYKNEFETAIKELL